MLLLTCALLLLPLGLLAVACTLAGYAGEGA